MIEFEYPVSRGQVVFPTCLPSGYDLQNLGDVLPLADGRIDPAEECARAEEALRPMMSCQGHMAAIEVLMSEARGNEEAYDESGKAGLAGHWQELCLRLAECHGALLSLWSGGAAVSPMSQPAEAVPDLLHRDGPPGDPAPSDELAELLPLLSQVRHVETLLGVLELVKGSAWQLGNQLAGEGHRWKAKECEIIVKGIEEILAPPEGC